MNQYFDNKDMFLEPNVKQYGSHMVMTNVQKPIKTKYYNLDTRFREDYDEYSKTSPSYYNISIPDRINNVKSISVCNIELPLSFYNISASLGNNIMQIKNNATSTTLVIPDNQYNAYGLETTINNELKNVHLQDLVCKIQGNKTYFSTISGETYVINFAVKTDMTESGVSVQPEFDKYNIKSKLGWLLGFRNIQYSITPASAVTKSIISESLIDLNGPKYLYLIVNDYSQGNPYSFKAPIATSFLNNNILAKISLDKRFNPAFNTGYVANKSNGDLLSDKRIYTGSVDIQRMTIQLVNEIGLPIDLNGQDFSFALEIQYE
jgi:hypothetical protein